MKTVTVKTAELEGAALDYAVFKTLDDDSKICFEGLFSGQVVSLCEMFFNADGRVCASLFNDAQGGDYEEVLYFPSADWALGGPLIEEHEISVICEHGHWSACTDFYIGMGGDASWDKYEDGPTALVAAMRAIVASKLGDTVEIPEELVK